MKKTSNTATKRGRPKKVVAVEATERKPVQKVGVPLWLEPTEHDISDELSRLDSFNYHSSRRF